MGLGAYTALCDRRPLPNEQSTDRHPRGRIDGRCPSRAGRVLSNCPIGRMLVRESRLCHRDAANVAVDEVEERCTVQGHEARMAVPRAARAGRLDDLERQMASRTREPGSHCDLSTIGPPRRTSRHSRHRALRLGVVPDLREARSCAVGARVDPRAGRECRASASRAVRRRITFMLTAGGIAVETREPANLSCQRRTRVGTRVSSNHQDNDQMASVRREPAVLASQRVVKTSAHLYAKVSYPRDQMRQRARAPAEERRR